VAGQSVFHFHFHVIPKYGKNEGFKIASGLIVVDDTKKIFEIIQKSLKIKIKK
jgi:histidine triad (HIT) family protein